MCHHFEYDRIGDLSETDREELLESHSEEELADELSESEREALEPTA